MEKASTRKLIAIIGGYRADKENRKSWLARVAKRIGVSVSVTKAAYYEDRCGKRTREKLLAEATKKASEDDSELILRIHAHIRYLESMDPEMFRADIDAAKRFLAHYQDYTSKRVFETIPPGVLDDC